MIDICKGKRTVETDHSILGNTLHLLLVGCCCVNMRDLWDLFEEQQLRLKLGDTAIRFNRSIVAVLLVDLSDY